MKLVLVSPPPSPSLPVAVAVAVAVDDGGMSIALLGGIVGGAAGGSSMLEAVYLGPTTCRPCPLGLALFALGGAPHSGGAATPLRA